MCPYEGWQYPRIVRGLRALSCGLVHFRNGKGGLALDCLQTPVPSLTFTFSTIFKYLISLMERSQFSRQNFGDLLCANDHRCHPSLPKDGPAKQETDVVAKPVSAVAKSDCVGDQRFPFRTDAETNSIAQFRARSRSMPQPMRARDFSEPYGTSIRSKCRHAVSKERWDRKIVLIWRKDLIEDASNDNDTVQYATGRISWQQVL
jgi:hypothetical protein